jgi:hypothetical protein
MTDYHKQGHQVVLDYRLKRSRIFRAIVLLSVYITYPFFLAASVLRRSRVISIAVTTAAAPLVVQSMA